MFGVRGRVFQARPLLLRIAFLVGYEDAGFRIVRGRDVMKRYVDILALRAAIFDQHVGNALRNFALLFRCASLNPGNLHVRHCSSSDESGGILSHSWCDSRDLLRADGAGFTLERW